MLLRDQIFGIKKKFLLIFTNQIGISKHYYSIERCEEVDTFIIYKGFNVEDRNFLKKKKYILKLTHFHELIFCYSKIKTYSYFFYGNNIKSWTNNSRRYNTWYSIFIHFILHKS